MLFATVFKIDLIYSVILYGGDSHNTLLTICHNKQPQKFPQNDNVPIVSVGVLWASCSSEHIFGGGGSFFVILMGVDK